MDIEYQLMSPSYHRYHNSERSIQTPKKQFIAWLYSVDSDLHIQLWDIMLQQAIVSLNLLQKSRLCPHLFAYTHIYRYLYYNYNLLVPTGKKVVIHNRQNNISPWEPHGKPAWYSGPAIKTLHITQGLHPYNKSGNNVPCSRFLEEKILHTKDFIYICCCSRRTIYHKWTVKYTTWQPTNYTRKHTQWVIEIPSFLFLTKQPPQKDLLYWYNQNSTNP